MRRGAQADRTAVAGRRKGGRGSRWARLLHLALRVDSESAQMETGRQTWREKLTKEKPPVGAATSVANANAPDSSTWAAPRPVSSSSSSYAGSQGQ